MERAIPRRPLRLIIGDCSGGLCRTIGSDALEVMPVLNYQHGEKIDLFLRKVCAGDYVVISDDDVFWLDDVPWNWAINQFEKDPNLVVASLLPRSRLSSILEGRLDQAMGSHCLVLRRKIWAREAFSFKVVCPPSGGGCDWFYDTGDYANVELPKRGYRIAIAPPEVQAHLVAFDGISSWSLKVRERSGSILGNVVNVPLRQEKALRAIMVVRSLSGLIAEQCRKELESELVPQPMLDKAESICRQFLTDQEIFEIHKSVQFQVATIKKHLIEHIGCDSYEKTSHIRGLVS